MTEYVRFGDVFELERVPLEIDPAVEYVQIGIRSFGNGIFHRPPVRGFDLSKLKYYHVYPDRMIFSNIMAWEGAVALSSSKEEGFVGSQRFLSYKCTSDKVCLPYVNYFFRSEQGALLVRRGSTGSVKRNQTLSSKSIEDFSLPLPCLDVQCSIVEKLDRVFIELAEKIERQRKIQEALRPSLLNAAFKGGL